MHVRNKLLAFGERCSDVWRAMLGRNSVSLESLNTQIQQLHSDLLTMAANQQAQLAGITQKYMTDSAAEKKEHWRRIGDLRGFAWVVYSQNGEDGILLEIFRRIGTTNRFFVEFGVESGVQCNTRYLAESHEWSGVYFEFVESDLIKLKERWKDNPRIQAVQACVTSENFERLLGEANVPQELDLLSIDIDSNDYWVWKSVNHWRPRVVAIEYNAFHDPPTKWVMTENLSYRWNQTTYFGASFTSLCLLGRSKGYTPVGTDPQGVNLFFVRNDCMNEQFLDAELHYLFQPFAYMRPATGSGPFEAI